MSWQPIETAPKDGTYILGLLPLGDKLSDRIIVISYWTEERCCEDAGYGCPDDFMAGWYDDEEEDWNPTHWMPLPEPPTQPTEPSGGPKT